MRIKYQVLSAAVIVALATPLAVSAPNQSNLSSAAVRAKGLADTIAAKALLRAGGDALTVRNVVPGAKGIEHARGTRTYQGLPVIGGDYVIHSKGGRLLGVSQSLRTTLRPQTTAARLSGAQAIIEAGAAFGTGFDGLPTSRKVVFALGKHSGNPVLAYEVVFKGTRADQTPTEMHYFIDAKSGAKLLSYDGIHTAPGPNPTCSGGTAAQGTGKTVRLGDVSINTTRCGTAYKLIDGTRGGGTTQNLATRRAGGVVFSDADNIWGNNAMSNAASTGAEAHYGVSETWDYYKATHGRNGIANNGKGALSRVHYGVNFFNAFWSDACFCMTFGDGNATSYPLTVLDIAGHEMSHGVTSNSAALVYLGEPGGLNEATSDIFGTMVEYFTNNSHDKPDYVIGERIFKRNDNLPAGALPSAIRFMFKPSLDGNSPDCYNPELGTLDVHYSSGVANHFFYLLAEGAVVPEGFGAGTQANLTAADLVCSGPSNLAGIGRADAEKIWYLALTGYMTSDTDYAAARVATLSASDELFGAGSPQSVAVAAAWTAVDVN